MSKTLIWIIAAVIASFIIITTVVLVLRARDSGVKIPFVNNQSTSSENNENLYDPPSDFSSQDDNPPIPMNASATIDFIPLTLPSTLR
ncbi:hypothetical protein KKG46_03965 [Patescibacteria group bacterium]|nr:hypothetical protein [Patescibacteria group bacterium]